ncbi:MAG: hypothetical protein Q9182_003394 [Xanthomendoza sp. 2 TL-2023]
MADGYARYTSKPQCVLMHVDVGTQGLGAAIHNASCGGAPVLIFAGLSPYTCDGEYRGSRTENVKQMVGRALQFATGAAAGSAYLIGPREVMEEEIEPYELERAHWGALGPSALPEDAVKETAEALVGAKEPLVITGYSGRITNLSPNSLPWRTR